MHGPIPPLAAFTLTTSPRTSRRKTAATADRGGAIDFKPLLKAYRAVQEKHRSRLLVRQTHGRRSPAADEE